MPTPFERYQRIPGLTVVPLPLGWAWVSDSATAFYIETADLTADVMDDYDERRSSRDPHDSGTAWSLLCSEVVGAHEADVPASVVAAFRGSHAARSISDDDPTTWGF